MVKGVGLSIRIAEGTRAALNRAAQDDLRSMSSLLEKIVTDWLRERDYLPELPKGGPSRKGRRPKPSSAAPAPAPEPERVEPAPATVARERPQRRRERRQRSPA